MLAERILKVSNALQIHEMEKVIKESSIEIRRLKSMVSVIEHGIHSRTLVISNNQEVLDMFKAKITGNISALLLDEVTYEELNQHALRITPEIIVLDEDAVKDKTLEEKLKNQGYTVYTF